MNWIDWVIVILLLVGLVRGLMKGLVYMVASLAAIVLGILLAVRLSHAARTFLEGRLDVNPAWLPVISFIFVFILVALGIYLLAFVLDKSLKAVALGIPNRILGGLFGLLMNALLLSVIISVLNTVNHSKGFLPNEAVAQSKLYEPVSKFAPAIFPSLHFENFSILHPALPGRQGHN